MSKKEIIEQMLNEMKKIIFQAIDEGKDGDLSPLELIGSLTQELILQQMIMDAESGGGGSVTQH